MDNKTILMLVVAIVLGMLVANIFKDVCGCRNLVEGSHGHHDPKGHQIGNPRPNPFLPRPAPVLDRGNTPSPSRTRQKPPSDHQ